MMKRLILASLTLVAALTVTKGQGYKTAGDYLDFFNNREAQVSKSYLSYMSESAHGNKIKHVEAKRRELVKSLRVAQAAAQRVQPYHGDTILKKSYERYTMLVNAVFNEDYGKIVDLEEIAEQSYDKMEAYLLAQEKAEEKLSEASEDFQNAFAKFAADNNIKLIDQQTKLSQKLEKIGKSHHYYHRIYLVFFKVYKQDAYLNDAVTRKDVNGIEQNRTTLLKYATEAQAKLDTAKPFQRDQSLVVAAKKYVQYAKMSGEKSAEATEYLLKADEFEKLKKVFDSGNKSKADVDKYNKALDSINKLVNAQNQRMQQLYKANTQALNGWNGSVKEFFESYTPKE